MESQTSNRRRHPRLAIEAPCKVYRERTRQFVSARTSNVSSGGALIEIDALRPVEPGEPIDLAVSWTPRPVLPASTMIRARAVRASSSGGTQTIAVEFLRPIAIAEAA